MVKAINLFNGTTFEEKITIMFELSGNEIEVKEHAKALDAISQQFNRIGVIKPTDDEEVAAMWLARKYAYFASFTLKPGAHSLSTDVCVPVSKLAECLEETKLDVLRSNLIAPLVGHVGDGNFHLIMLYTPGTEEAQIAQELHDRLVKRAIRMDGTCSGEHGIGVEKKAYLPLELGQDAVNVMRIIKRALDPNNIFNPGKVIDV